MIVLVVKFRPQEREKIKNGKSAAGMRGVDATEKNSPSVDRVFGRCYYTYMMKHTTETTVARKKRSDRNHIIYELRVAGGNYIGVTAKTESTVLKSVKARAAKHFYRAKTESKDWTLCVALRELNDKVRAVEQLYQRWFQRPIPPKGLNLNWPPSPALQELYRPPSDQPLG